MIAVISSITDKILNLPPYNTINHCKAEKSKTRPKSLSIPKNKLRPLIFTLTVRRLSVKFNELLLKILGPGAAAQYVVSLHGELETTVCLQYFVRGEGD